MKKLRIGVLFPHTGKLKNWECRIFSALIESDWADIVVLIKDKNKKKKINDLNTKNIIGKILLKLIQFFENVLIKYKYKNQYRFYEKEKFKILKKLSQVKEVYVNPISQGKYVNYFNKSDCQKIKDLKLDVLLRHEFKIIKGDILNIPKNGIWSFHHGDNDINRGGPPGFWEIMFNQPVTGVTLQILTEELDGGKIIEKGFYSTKKIFSLNQKFIYEKSVEVILKNLRFLHLNGFIKSLPSKTYTKKMLTTPNTFWILKYCFFCIKNIFSRTKNIFLKFMNYKLNCWSILSKKGRIFSSDLSEAKFIKAGKDEFWADPFVISFESKNYVFFENYSYKLKKGKISCGILSEEGIKDVCDVLELDYHVSYPFVFKMNDDFFMMPETCEAKRLEIYKAVNFPNKWQLYSKGFEGEGIADPTLFLDKKKNIWLFVNKAKELYDDYNSELYIYKIDDLKLTTIIPHKLNPVIIDSRRARSAGNIFVEDGKIIRPSQNNIHSIYGYGLNLLEIKELSLENYKEELIKMFEPNFKDDLVGVHHVSQFEDGFLFDSCKKYIK